MFSTLSKNPHLKSLEYEALKRKDSYEKIKPYIHYKLILVQKYNELQKRKNKLLKNNKQFFSSFKKNSHLVSNEKTRSPDICLPKKINKNLSLINIKFPNFYSNRKKYNPQIYLNYSDLPKQKY